MILRGIIIQQVTAVKYLWFSSGVDSEEPEPSSEDESDARTNQTEREDETDRQYIIWNCTTGEIRYIHSEKAK